MTLQETVTMNLKRTRLRRKLSQGELSARTGYAVSYISMLERGKRSPPLDTLEKLAAALGVLPTKLLAA